jgi:hypothetical protein
MRASIRRNISAASTGRVRSEIDPSANLPLRRNEGAKAGILRRPRWRAVKHATAMSVTFAAPLPEIATARSLSALLGGCG